MAFGEISSAGGGSIIASAAVEIGANLAPLRAAEEEVKAIVARIGQMTAGIGGGGGIGAGGGFSGGFAGSPNLGSSFGGSGGTFGGTSGSFNVSGSSPSFGSIGGTFSNSPNLGTMSASFGGVGGGGGIGGGIEQAIATATQNAVQSAVQRVNQAVASTLEGQFGPAGMYNRGGPGNNASYAFESALNGGASYSMGQPLHRTNDFGNSRGSFAYDYSDVNAARPYSMDNGYAFGRPESGFQTGQSSAFGNVGDRIELSPGRQAALNAFAQRMQGQQGSSGVGGFGPYGAISRATGIPYAGVIGAAIVAHTVFEATQGIAIANAGYDPDLATNGLYSAGSDFNLANDPRARLAARNIAGITRSESISGALPGGRFLDAVSGRQRTNAREGAFAREVLGIQGFVENAYYPQGLQEATLGGDPIAIQQAKNDQSLAPFTNAYLANPTAESLAAASRQNNINSVEMQFARRSYAGSITSLTGNMDAARNSVTAANLNYRSILESGAGNEIGSLGSRRSSVETLGAAKADAYESETVGVLSGIRDRNTFDITKNARGSEVQRMRQETQSQLAEIDNQIAQAQRRVESLGFAANSALAGAAGNAYQSQILSLQGQLAGMAPNDPGRGAVTSQMTAAGITSGREAGFGYISSVAGAAAANLRAGRNFFEAQLMESDASYAISAARLDKSDPNYQTNLQNLQHLYGAQRNAMTVEHEQTLQLEREGYATQVAVAGEEMSLRPISGGAVGAVANARRMVELASNQERGNAVAAGRASLRAASFGLTAQRGGEVAIDMSLSQALGAMYGSGVDLTGRRADISRAQGIYAKGDKELDSAQLNGGKAAAALDDESKKNLDDIANFIRTLIGKPAVIGLFKQ